ncbi:type I-E CRISPR-associated protein Cse1/CasA [Azospirillum halopraeferens]|uniref:type I-E CRISPR-associated protein Cse1/CasA n=1 Tax=Azospirillum halopraeferens TaxID=34010 RepID=UPI00040C58CB|nr:type I-E CRISPR-associated protein Cse1/CasA [Azospirillum halopraeferens]
MHDPEVLNFLTIPVPVVRRSGPGLATPAEITAGHADDPVVGVRLGHPLADRGFEFLMRDLLQAALAPADAAAWRRMLFDPPEPGDLAERLAPYHPAFGLTHPAHPAMQVRPDPQRLAQAAARAPSRSRRPAPGDDDDDGDGGEAGTLPIAALLPDLPTGEAVKQDADFFVRRGGVEAIGAAAILPVLYAHMVLFPPGGGGYLGLPHGADSIKFQLLGGTLWQTLWLNVLCREAEGGGDARWPAPVDEGTFPWLDPTLAVMPLGRNEDGAARPVGRGGLHPAHIPMPRRYLLAPPVPGRCALTGVEGPVFTAYSRWPKGLQYQPQGWWHPAVSRIEDTAKPDDPPRFVRARGPLRFDDWLETALLREGAPPSGKAQVKRRLFPPVLRQFASQRDTLASPRPDGAATAVMEEGIFRVRAFAQFSFGKAPGGMSQRELPVWLSPEPGDTAWLAMEVTEVAGLVNDLAGNLFVSARAACTLGRRDVTAALPDTLKDALLAEMDAAVLDLPGRLAAIIRDHATDAARFAAADGHRRRLLTLGRNAALRLFDDAFPIDGTGPSDGRLAAERAALVRRLHDTLSFGLTAQGAS